MKSEDVEFKNYYKLVNMVGQKVMKWMTRILGLEGIWKIKIWGEKDGHRFVVILPSMVLQDG